MPSFLMALAPAWSQQAGKATLLNNNRVGTSERRQRIDTDVMYVTEVNVAPLSLPGKRANISAQLNQAVVVCPDDTPSPREWIVGFDNEANWRDLAALFGSGMGSRPIRMRVSDSAGTRTIFDPYDWTNKTIALPNITGGIPTSSSQGVVAVLELNTSGSSWPQLGDSASIYLDYSMFACGDLP